MWLTPSFGVAKKLFAGNALKGKVNQCMPGTPTHVRNSTLIHSHHSGHALAVWLSSAGAGVLP
jgi:hypothetical protein